MGFVFWRVSDNDFNVINIDNVRRIGIGKGLRNPVITFFFTENHAIEYKLPELFTRRDVMILLNRLFSDPIVDLDDLVEGILRRRKKDEETEAMKDDNKRRR